MTQPPAGILSQFAAGLILICRWEGACNAWGADFGGPSQPSWNCLDVAILPHATAGRIRLSLASAADSAVSGRGTMVAVCFQSENPADALPSNSADCQWLESSKSIA